MTRQEVYRVTNDHALNELRFIESLGDACLIVGPTRLVIAANAPAEQMYGRSTSQIVGSPITELAPLEERDTMLAEIATCNGTPRHFHAIQTRASGARFVGEFTAKACRASEPGTVFLLIREARSHDPEVLQDLALNTLMLNHVKDGIVCHTVAGDLLFANRAALSSWRLENLEAGQALGPFGWVASGQKPHIQELTDAILSDGEARFESHGTAAGGNEVHLEIHATVAETSAGKVVVSSIRDISERMITEEMVRYMAYHDDLTGLANRVLLESDLAHALSLSDRHGDLVGLIFLDLNDFKPVNDTYGHAIGDLVLREVADRIAGTVRKSDTVARPGGDEFVVLLPRLDAPSDLALIAEKLSHEISRPMHINDLNISVAATLGLALHMPGEKAEDFLIRADLAMYEARDRDVTGWSLYSEP